MDYYCFCKFCLVSKCVVEIGRIIAVNGVADEESRTF